MTELQFQEEGHPRLDAFLAKKYSGKNIGGFYKYWRKNQIKLNNKKQPLSTRLQPGDTIQLYFSQDNYISPCIVYEDRHLLAVNKPAGLVSLDTCQDKKSDSMLQRSLEYLERQGGFSPREEKDFTPALCHRLDTGTSGILLLAKTQPMYFLLLSLIKNHDLIKKYLCVTTQIPHPAEAVLRGNLVKNEKQGIVSIDKTGTRGKPIATQYKTLATSGSLALLEVQLITGRTHQIRAHLASAGAPILGDGKYGDNKINRKYRCRYQCLCASEIVFPAKLPEGFAAYANLQLRCQPPWYVEQMLDGTLGLSHKE